MVEIIVSTISPVRNQTGKKDEQRGSGGSKKRKRRDRRLNQTDRRRGAREGVVVTLSTDLNRRKTPDRRKGTLFPYPAGCVKPSEP